MKKQKHILAILSVLILTLAVATIIPSRITATEETGTNELLESPVPVEAEEGQEVAEPEEQEEAVAPAEETAAPEEETAAPEEEEELNVSLQSAPDDEESGDEGGEETSDVVEVRIDGPSAATGDQRGLINNALATPHEGKTLHVILEKGESDGVYVINGILNIYSDTILELGDGVVIKRNGFSDYMVWTPTSDKGGYSNASNITITGGTWDDGNNSEAGIFHFIHADNIQVSDTTLQNCKADHVIILDAVQNATISGTTFKDCIANSNHHGDRRYVNEAIHIDQTPNNRGSNDPVPAPRDGTPCKNITVDGCTFDGVCCAVGAHVHNEADKSHSGITVTNNIVKKVDSGSTIFTAAQSTGWKVQNNTIYDNCGADVFARLNGCKSFSISNNKGSSSQEIKGLTYFVYDNGGDKNLSSSGTISGHTVTVKKSAITCYNVASNLTIKNEKYKTTQTSFSANNKDNFILYIEAAKYGERMPTANIQNCEFKYAVETTSTGNFYLAGIKLARGNFTFKNNKVSSTPGAGLYLSQASSKTYIEDNEFSRCGTARKGATTDGCTIVLEKCNYVKVKNNIINESWLSGIYLNGSSNNTITGNTISYPGTSSSNWVKGHPILLYTKSKDNSIYNNNFKGTADMRASADSTGNFATWSGGTKLPVSATAKYSLKNADKIAVKSGGTYIAVEGNNTVKAKKKGSGTIKLIQNGRERASKKIEVYAYSGQYIMVSSINSNYCLDIRGKSKNNNAQMIVWTRNGGKNQKYSFHLQSDGTYAIRCIHSGKWVTVKDNSKSQSAKVVQYSWTGKAGQRWKIQVDAKNNITFVNANSGKAFDVRHGKAVKGKEMIQYTINGGSNQKWNPKKA